MVNNGFMKPEYRAMLQIENDPDKLIERMNNYSPPKMKWEENTR
jgi:hypothetical protein